MSENLLSTAIWEDIPIDISKESDFIWSIANKLRGVYMPDKYGDVIIPMTIIRRFECAQVLYPYFLFSKNHFNK